MKSTQDSSLSNQPAGDSFLKSSLLPQTTENTELIPSDSFKRTPGNALETTDQLSESSFKEGLTDPTETELQKVERQVNDLIRGAVAGNPQLKELLQNGVVKDLLNTGGDPKEINKILRNSIADSRFGGIIRNLPGPLKTLARKFAMLFSPPQTDPLVREIFDTIDRSDYQPSKEKVSGNKALPRDFAYDII